MKKKVAFILAIIFSLGALALTACTDKNKDNDNNPRQLDSFEQSIVGTWISHSNGGTLTFKSDGTYFDSDGGKGTFKHGNASTDDFLGRFEAIQISEPGHYRLYDAYPDRLYYADSMVWGYFERQ